MLKEKLLEDLKLAMKEKNVNKKNAIQMVRASILQKEKDGGIELSDDQILEVIVKENKKREEALEEYKKSGREELIAQIEEEMLALKDYLPEKMDEEELKATIKGIIEETGASSMKDMGIVMKEAKNKCGLRADGRDINKVVKEMLT